jgi:hypothetical protein
LRIFRPKSDEVSGDWRKLYNEVRNDLYYSPNIIRVIKSRRMRWVGHVVSTGERRGVYRVLVGKPEGKRPLGRHRDGGIILKESARSGMWGHGLDRRGSRLGQVASTCKRGNELTGSIKCREFLD